MKRYVISVHLVEVEEFAATKRTTQIGSFGCFRSHSENSAKLKYDSIVKQLREQGITFDNDDISGETCGIETTQIR